MGSVELHVDPSTMEPTGSGSIVGELWLTLNGVAFPHERWTDFVVPILTWFTNGLSKLRDGADSVTVGFMEGPYAVEISVASEGRLRLRALVGANGNEELSTVVGAQDFAESILCSADAVLTECESRRWLDSHMEYLRRGRDDLTARTAN